MGKVGRWGLCSAHEPVVREALQVNDEQGRQPPDANLLERLHMALAPRTVPAPVSGPQCQSIKITRDTVMSGKIDLLPRSDLRVRGQ